MFSCLPEDESLDDIKPQKIRLAYSLHEDPIPIEEFADAVIISDDMDVISDRKIRDEVHKM